MTSNQKDQRNNDIQQWTHKDDRSVTTKSSGIVPAIKSSDFLKPLKHAYKRDIIREKSKLCIYISIIGCIYCQN